MNIFAILLVTTLIGADEPPPAAPKFDCQAARVELMQSLKPIVDPDASESSPEDQDPATVQFLVVDGLKASEGRVSANGQIIILPLAAVEGADANELIGARLFASAVDMLLNLKVGDRCQPLVVGEAGA